MSNTEEAPGPESSLNKGTRGAEGLSEREREVCRRVAISPAGAGGGVGAPQE